MLNELRCFPLGYTESSGSVNGNRGELVNHGDEMIRDPIIQTHLQVLLKAGKTKCTEYMSHELVCFHMDSSNHVNGIGRRCSVTR